MNVASRVFGIVQPRVMGPTDQLAAARVCGAAPNNQKGSVLVIRENHFVHRVCTVENFVKNTFQWLGVCFVGSRSSERDLNVGWFCP